MKQAITSRNAGPVFVGAAEAAIVGGIEAAALSRLSPLLHVRIQRTEEH